MAAEARSAGLPPERSGYPAPPDLLERRAGMMAAIAAGLWRTDPPPEQIRLGGIRALRFAPASPSRGVVLHIHGGAFRIGSPETIAPFAAALAARCGVTVVCPAYRLAPEHPFPAGLLDGWNALQAVLGSVPSLVVSGDSAGGGIAAGLTQLATAQGAAIAGLALLSPWLDLRADSPSFLSNASSDPLFSLAAAREAAELYLQGLAADDPLASPLQGNVDRFPPIHISVGTGEVLRDDAERFHEKSQAAGVRSELFCIAQMEHVAATRDPSLTGSAEAFEHLARFVDGCIAHT